MEQQPKLRRYEGIWHRIRDSVGDTASVRIHKGYAATLIQGVKREKSAQNTLRKTLGAVSWGKLEISQQEVPGTDQVIISFRLLWNANKM